MTSEEISIFSIALNDGKDTRGSYLTYKVLALDILEASTMAKAYQEILPNYKIDSITRDCFIRAISAKAMDVMLEQWLEEDGDYYASEDVEEENTEE